MVVLCHSMSLRDLHISIHVPAWGTTEYHERALLLQRDFNPRSRVGNDDNKAVPIDGVVLISIHVPAWGTTFLFKVSETLILLFQSTFPRGERRERSSY